MKVEILHAIHGYTITSGDFPVIPRKGEVLSLGHPDPYMVTEVRYVATFSQLVRVDIFVTPSPRK